MAITTFVASQILTAAQMNAVQSNDFNQTVSTKTTSYTLVAADKGTRVVMNSGSATTITVNTSLFSAGDTLVLQNIGAGVCTVTAGTATVSSAGPLAIPQNGSGLLYFTSAGVSIFYPSAVTVTSNEVAVFNETQASGTAGGTFTAGSYVKRTLNTTVVNQITSCTLTSSVISLPAGTYEVFFSAPAFNVFGHQARLRNTTDSSDIQYASSSYVAGTTGFAVTRSELQTVFTLAGTKNIEVQHRSNQTKASNGLGVETNFGNDEIYTQITITKIA